MRSFVVGIWMQVLVYTLLLQLQTVKVQGFDPVSQKLQRLNDQFQQFQALTQTRLNMLDLNQNRSSLQALKRRVQALNDHYHHVSQDLEHLKQSTTQEIEDLRETNRKLEKKNKRLMGRLTSMERKLRENCHQTEKMTADPDQDFFNLTLELRSQEERLAALQIQRDELLIGLKGLLESLKNQATRLAQLEGRLICNVDSMVLFPSASAENYVTFSLSLPALLELSLCLWLRVETPHIGTLLSYATDDSDNQLVLYGHRSSSSSTPFSVSSPSSPSSSPSLDFVIRDPVYRRLQVSPLLDAHWHHVCVLWSSIHGRFWHYNDHLLASSGSDFRKGWEVPGGGSVVLGQEQDSVGGGFDPAEGFAGQMAGFRLWNRVLSPSEVEGVVAGRGVPRGVVLGMEDIKEVHGAVHHVACDCLEYCG
ncbi:pentraxin-4 [Neolamprologus brichardi]|uniref:pentraxin-4 n=1 Tax=Neolamprologus brichardi TaxID=32507 RepID=UPI001643DF8C|nr:pentraxin-4 [Neolamprologus brichardi]